MSILYTFCSFLNNIFTIFLSSRRYFTFSVLLLFTCVAFVNSNLNEWPNPTCANDQTTHCKIKNVNQPIKNDIIFYAGDFDANHYKTLTVSGGILSFIPTNLFFHFTNLEKLKLSNCNLLKFELPNVRNEKLKTVFIDKTEMTSVDNFAFHGADHLEDVWLGYNKIKTVGSLAFYNLNKLIILAIDNNELDALDRDTFRNTMKLKTLLLHKNNLDNIDFIEVLNSLNTLDLGHNRITMINPKLFSNKNHLKKLLLYDNCLINFDFDGYPVKDLEILRLDENYIEEISSIGVTTNFLILSEFFIDRNNINCTHLRTVIDAVHESNIRVNLKTDKIPNLH